MGIGWYTTFWMIPVSRAECSLDPSSLVTLTGPSARTHFTLRDSSRIFQERRLTGMRALRSSGAWEAERLISLVIAFGKYTEKANRK